MAEPASGPAVDGRRLRSERTRQLIIEAYLALLREYPQVPTSAQIAERAGCSVRSVFERFPDLLALRIAATDHALALGSARAVLRDVDGDRSIRIRPQVETRSRTCERSGRLWRALNANRRESAELKQRIGELGTHARSLWLVRRAGLRPLEAHHRPDHAVDAGILG